ncbi:MAG: pyruvate ferredoxin oxidoreductase [Elusimicrobia bacterium]|nr:pyruvate ferredoxin oxidoreductase [Elusimicrobiota bacterium]
MKINLKEMCKLPARLGSGHRMCSGCGAPIVAKMIMMGTDKPLVVTNATGCLEVATTIYPYTAWNIPWIHNAFENSAATASGVETAYRALKKKGKIKKEIKFLAFGGDGGTHDIGIQSLSGALERGHNFVYVCYNNEAYMNTGIQRSGATTRGAATTTSPAGEVMQGKTVFAKDLTYICAAHNVPYVAQGSISNWKDLIEKSNKAFEKEGPAFIHVLSPCPPGWKYPPEKSVELAKVAVECKIWPLYEVEDGQWRITYTPKKPVPVDEWLKMQGRFRHLYKEENKHIIDEIQEWTDNNWKRLENFQAATQKNTKENA